MDADTRHQLKQNELAETLSKLRDFSDRRTIGWLVVIVLIALGYAGWKYWNWREAARLAQASQEVVQIDVSDPALGDAPLTQLRQIISKGDNAATTLARLKLAEGLQARGRAAGGGAKLDEAEQEYRNLVERANTSMNIRAAAWYRLGMLYETKRDFAKAREAYAKLTGDSSYAGSPFQDFASIRTDSLDELDAQVKFTPGVKPLPPVEVPAAETPPAEVPPLATMPETDESTATAPSEGNEATEPEPTPEPEDPNNP